MSTPELRLKWVELFNFKSYRGKHRFTFPTKPGLYSITGKNLVNPRLGANGVGKSSLLDAVFWSFYGRTPRGLRAGDVIHHGEHTAQVAVCFGMDNGEYVATRRQAPNQITLKGPFHEAKVVSQDDLTGYIGLTAEQFCYAVLLPQFGVAFFDLLPSAKLSLFSQIMELDYWLDKSEQASLQVDQLDHVISQTDNELSRQEGKYEILSCDIRVMEGKPLTDHSKTIAGFEAKLASHRAKQQAVSAILKKHNTTRILVENDIAHTSEALVNIQDLHDLKGVCPTCRQTVSRDHLRAEKLRLVDHHSALKTHLRAALHDCDATQSELDQLLRDELAIRQNLKDWERLQAEYEAMTAMLKQKRGQLASIEKSLGGLFKDYDKLKANRESVDFWVAGFKRIRLFIIDETLRQFELEVNNNLASLGLPDWRIEFDVERETKSGTVSKGFVVMVYPPMGGEPVRLEAWSGDETQRLRLAGDLGLANLIMDRAGMRNTIEIYDEPSSHLSQEGLVDLLDTLQQRATDYGKIIMVVDHHSLDYGFDGTFTVFKDENTSYLEA